jgi:hypothetical protein
MAKEDEIMVLESVGGVDQDSPKLNMNPVTKF